MVGTARGDHAERPRPHIPLVIASSLGQRSLAPDAVVIGAGPGGLAAAACISLKGLDVLILERSKTVAASWHAHYERLHLHTDKNSSALPFLPMPGFYPRYPSLQQVIAYFETYADHFELKPHFNQDVLRVEEEDGLWRVSTQNARYTTPNLVLATGNAQLPYRPVVAGLASFGGDALHSADYRSGARYVGKRVLVVGLGNSGGEIALDLLEHGALPSISVRGPINIIPRDVLGIPVVSLVAVLRHLPRRLADALASLTSRVVFGNLQGYGLRRPDYGPLEQIYTRRQIPLIDAGTVRAIKRGYIEVVPGVESFISEGVLFTDGTSSPFDAVVFATGFRPNVPVVVSQEPDRTNQVGQAGAAHPRLFTCGFEVAATGMLNQIGLEARRIAAEITASTPH